MKNQIEKEKIRRKTLERTLDESCVMQMCPCIVLEPKYIFKSDYVYLKREKRHVKNQNEKENIWRKTPERTLNESCVRKMQMCPCIVLEPKYIFKSDYIYL